MGSEKMEASESRGHLWAPFCVVYFRVLRGVAAVHKALADSGPVLPLVGDKCWTSPSGTQEAKAGGFL